MTHLPNGANFLRRDWATGGIGFDSPSPDQSESVQFEFDQSTDVIFEPRELGQFTAYSAGLELDSFEGVEDAA